MEIEQLKIEHERFKEALSTIHLCYPKSQDAWRVADEALNPHPVTLEDLKTALANYNVYLTCICFHSDESGRIMTGCGEDTVFEFYTLRAALDFLNSGAVASSRNVALS